jgi:uncharacterized protein YndB with AHSA1/START domain
MENQTIVVENTYHAPIERVWKAITDIEQMKQWFVQGLREFKPKVGFVSRFEFECHGKQLIYVWKVTEATPPHKISYEWAFEGYEGNSLVTFELLEKGETTHIKLTHTGLETFRAELHQELPVSLYINGWGTYIGELLKDFVEDDNL